VLTGVTGATVLFGNVTKQVLTPLKDVSLSGSRTNRVSPSIFDTWDFMSFDICISNKMYENLCYKGTILSIYLRQPITYTFKLSTRFNRVPVSFLCDLDQVRKKFVQALWRVMLFGESITEHDDFVSKGVTLLGIRHRLFDCGMTCIAVLNYLVNDCLHKRMVITAIFMRTPVNKIIKSNKHTMPWLAAIA